MIFTTISGLLLLGSAVCEQPVAGEIYRKNRNAVATFQWRAGGGDTVVTQGTAFFLGPQLIVTNIHVAADQASLAGTSLPYLVLHNGDSLPLIMAGIHSVNEGADIAVVRIPAMVTNSFIESLAQEGSVSFSEYLDLPHIKIADSSPDVGDDVFIIGSPLGLDQSLSSGIVSSIRDVEHFGTCYQTTAPISPGSSGSPAFNSDGELIGIATFKHIGGESLNFLVPSSAAFGNEKMEGTLFTWAASVPTESERQLAREVYDETHKAIVDLLELAEQSGNELSDQRVKLAIAQIDGNRPDVFDAHRWEPEKTSWGILADESMRVLRDAGDERFGELYKLILQRAMVVESTGTREVMPLRFAASLGGSDARDRYLELCPEDELVRWERAVDNGSYFLKTPNALKEYGEAVFLLESIDRRRETLLEDLAHLANANAAWEEHARFVALHLQASVLAGDLEFALAQARKLSDLPQRMPDVFFGTDLYRNHLAASIETVIALEDLDPDRVREFARAIKLIHYDESRDLGLEVVKALKMY